MDRQWSFQINAGLDRFGRLSGFIGVNNHTNWRVRTSNLLDQDQPLMVSLDQVSSPWSALVDFHCNGSGYRDRRKITKILTEVIAQAFGRSESLLKEYDDRPVQVQFIDSMTGLIEIESNWYSEKITS